MSRIVWRPGPRRVYAKVLPERPAHDTTTYAPHLRARVQRGRIGWWFEVVNTRTGERVAHDNGHATMADAFADAEFCAAAARQAWMRGFTRKVLR